MDVIYLYTVEVFQRSGQINSYYQEISNIAQKEAFLKSRAKHIKSALPKELQNVCAKKVEYTFSCYNL